MTIICDFGKFCQFLQIFDDLWNFFGNLAVGQCNGHYSYTLRIASGHNEFGSHFTDIENV